MILISIVAVICAIGCVVCGFGWFKSHRNLIEERLLNQSIRADTQSKIDESEEETGNLVRHRALRKTALNHISTLHNKFIKLFIVYA